MIATLLKPIPAAICALLIYGSWAGYSNVEHGSKVFLQAFAVQGLFAFAATLTLGSLARNLYQRAGATHAALVLAFLCCMLLALAIPVSIHWLLATPAIVQSILPGFIIGNGYIAALLISEHRKTTGA